MIYDRIQRLGQGSSSMQRRTRAGERGEVQTLREMVTILREQLQQKEAELEARRDEVHQMLLVHEREVRQLHVVLLHGAQGRELPSMETTPLLEPASTVAPEGPTPSPPSLAVPEPTTPAVPPLAPVAQADSLGPALRSSVGNLLGMANAAASTTYEPLNLQQLADVAELDVATAWQYCQAFADEMVTVRPVGIAPAGRIWAPIDAALLHTIHMLYSAGATTEAIHEVLATAQRTAVRSGPRPADESRSRPADAEEGVALAQPPSQRRGWWHRLLGRE